MATSSFTEQSPRVVPQLADMNHRVSRASQDEGSAGFLEPYMSVHNQRYPWPRILPYPPSTSSSNASAVPSDHHAVSSRHLATNSSIQLASTAKQSPSVPNGPSEVTNLLQRPAHHMQTSSATQAYCTSTTLDDHLTGSATMATDDLQRSSSPSDSLTPDAVGKYCLCQNEPHIPRPRNAFILYRQHQHASVVAQNPNLPNPDISKIIGEQWRALPESIKEEWKALADEEKARHSQQYPDYRYRPKRGSRNSVAPAIVGQTPIVIEEQIHCQKCGGKPVIAPTSYPLPAATTTPDTLHHPSDRIPMDRQQHFGVHNFAASPHDARSFHPARPFVHGPNNQQTQAPLFGGRYRSPVEENADAKRRRLNETNPYAARPPRSEYPRPLQGEMVVRTGTSMQPATSSSPHFQMANTNLQQSPFAPQRREQNFTLPPLQTITSHTHNQSQRRATYTQKQTIEAMIMSIPVLTKVKILSQVSPSYVNDDDHIGKPSKTRGAVIAVEGLDSKSVFDMTVSLAQQLERDGNFAVRIFDGPNPYQLLEVPTSVGTNPDGTSINFSDCLSNIACWHLVSSEIKDYITGLSKIGHHGSDVSERVNVTASNASTLIGNKSGDVQSSGQAIQRDRSASQSAYVSSDSISPKAIPKTGSQAFGITNAQSQFGTPGNLDKDGEPRRPKSRIPAAALAQSNRAAQSAQSGLISAIGSSPLNALSRERQRQISSEQEPTTSQAPEVTQSLSNTPTSLQHSSKNNKNNIDNNNNNTGDDQTHMRTQSRAVIPIAIVPHYQLTTVNASAINMPIKDTYSPHSHWQWLATLWRGCVGPDITIVLKSTPDDGDLSADGSQSAIIGGGGGGSLASAFPVATPASAHSQSIKSQPRPSHAPTTNPLNLNAKATGVEIRLSDYKTIIVKTASPSPIYDDGSGGSGNSRLGSTAGRQGSVINDGTLEAWEKAKRRVGFEVDEYLRK